MIPDGFVRRMQTLLGDEANQLLAALARPPVIGLRVNTLKLSPQDFKTISPWVLKPVPWCPTGFSLDQAKPGQHPYHKAGLYYLQDPSAMAVAEIVDPQAGELILDLAAAPGGKTSHLAALSPNSTIVANEVSRTRVKALLENVERWGARNVVVLNNTLDALLKTWQACFDKVLLDAPCSGEGMFRKSESARTMWQESTVYACAKRQDKLIEQAAQLVKPGGSLIYSTCTFAPEENEHIIAHFLTKHPDFVLDEIKRPLDRGQTPWLPKDSPHYDMSKTLRLWPHKLQGEGHFIARLTKQQGAHGKTLWASFPSPSQAGLKLWQEFCSSTLKDSFNPTHFTAFKDALYALPKRIPHLQGLNVRRVGLRLGRLKKNRFEPSHALAMALNKTTASKMLTLNLEPKDPLVNHYLQGHLLENPGEQGWLLLTISGYPLAWGKRSGGSIKNFYPKGLRL